LGEAVGDKPEVIRLVFGERFTRMEAKVAEVPAVAGDQRDIDGKSGEFASGMPGVEDNSAGSGCKAS